MTSTNVITVTSGNTVTLPCTAQPDSDKYGLEWVKEGRGQIYTSFSGTPQGHAAEGYSGRLSHNSDGGLQIQAKPGDSGVYYCVLKTFNRPADHPKGRRIQLHVQSLPYLIAVPLDNVYRSPGAPVSLSCKAGGDPEPSFSWKKDGEHLVENERITIKGGHLKLEEVQQNDQGAYTCIARNDVGVRKHTTHLKFANRPFFTYAPTNKTQVEDSTLIWRCHAQAEPNLLQYKWFYDDKEVYTSVIGPRARVLDGGNLNIKDLRREDSGLFRCEVSNGFGEPVTAAAHLDVLYPATISRLTPSIQYVPLGLSSSIHCKIEANPPPSYVNWAKQGRVLDVDSPNSNFYLSNNGSELNFRNVNKHDAGVYTCQAYNTVGGGDSFEVHLLAAEPPFYSIEPVKEVRCKRGKSVTLRCGGGGTPQPEIFWTTSDGSSPPSDRTTEVRTGQELSLKITGLRASDHGKYFCVLKTHVTILKKGTLIVIEDTIPQRPQSVNVVTNSFDATVSWQPGYDGGHQQKFILQYRDTQQTEKSWIQVNVGTERKHLVTHLKPGSPYEFRVIASNELGSGEASQPTLVDTKGFNMIGTLPPVDAAGATYFPILDKSYGPRPNPPRNLVVSKDVQHLVFSWDPPIMKPDIPIYFYHLEFKEAEKGRLNDDRPFQPLHQRIADTKYRLSLPSSHPLSPHTSYQFQVRAHSIASFSQPSNSVTYAMPGFSAQFALTAAILGGLLFLLVFLVVGFLLVRRNRTRRKEKVLKRRVNGANGYANGNGKNMVVLDSNGSSPYPITRQSHGNGFVDVADESRVPGLGNLTERDVQAGFHTPPSIRQSPMNHSFASPKPADQTNTNSVSFDSVSGLLKHFDTDSWTRRPAKHVSFDTQNDKHNKMDFKPIGGAGYLFKVEPEEIKGSGPPYGRSTLEYTRDKLMGTIDRLRKVRLTSTPNPQRYNSSTELANNYSVLSESTSSPPTHEAPPVPYPSISSLSTNQRQTSMRLHKSNSGPKVIAALCDPGSETLRRTQSARMGPRPITRGEGHLTLGASSPSPAGSSSSGFSSENSGGSSSKTYPNTLTEMLQEKYIYGQADELDLSIDSAHPPAYEDENEVRFERLKQEFRRAKASGVDITAQFDMQTHVIESEVL